MWNIRCSIIVFVLMLTHTREIIALYAFVNNGVNELIVFRYIYIYISKTRVTTRSIQIFFSYHYFCMKFLEIFGNPDIPLNVYFFKLRSLQLFEINHNRETKLSTQCFIFNLKRTISRLLYVFVPRFQKYELFPSINIILFRVL